MWPMWFPVYASMVLFGGCITSFRPPSPLQHSVGVAGWALPHRDFHPARNAKLSLAHNGIELSCPAAQGSQQSLYGNLATKTSHTFSPASRVSCSASPCNNSAERLIVGRNGRNATVLEGHIPNPGHFPAPSGAKPYSSDG